jgi:hypothetical protein
MTLTRLISRNRQIAERVTEAQIDKFLELLSREKDPAYLRFLATLCVVGDWPINKHQSYVRDALLVEKQAGPCFYRMELRGRKLFVQTDPLQPWREFSSFCQNGPAKDVNYVEQSLILFRKLCQGRNQRSIDVLTSVNGYLDLELCLCSLENSELPPNFRARFCELSM